MQTYDFDFVEEEKKVVKPQSLPDAESNDFKVLSIKVNPLVKFHAINMHFNLKKLLEDFGCDVRRTNMFCPFHDDEASGKPSGKYHPSTDLLYCFSESKNYSAYHALKLLYHADIDAKFAEAWGNLEQSVKDELILKYDNEEDAGKESKGSFAHPIWDQLRFVHNKFAKREVDFKQHKNALHKIFSMIYQEDVKKNETIMRLKHGGDEVQ